MAIAELAAQVEYYARLAYQRGLVGAAGGNVSARDPEEGLVAITPSGVSLRDVTAENLLYVDLEGKVVKGPGGLRPSKETPLHLSVYRARPQAGGIVHVHPSYATAYSLVGRPIPVRTVSAEMKLIQVPVVKKAAPGSPELVSFLMEALSTAPDYAKVFLLEAHGLLGFECTLLEAFDLVELAEETARTAYLADLLSGCCPAKI